MSLWCCVSFWPGGQEGLKAESMFLWLFPPPPIQICSIWLETHSCFNWISIQPDEAPLYSLLPGHFPLLGKFIVRSRQSWGAVRREPVRPRLLRSPLLMLLVNVWDMIWPSKKRKTNTKTCKKTNTKTKTKRPLMHCVSEAPAIAQPLAYATGGQWEKHWRHDMTKRKANTKTCTIYCTITVEKSQDMFMPLVIPGADKRKHLVQSQKFSIRNL